MTKDEAPQKPKSAIIESKPMFETVNKHQKSNNESDEE